MKITLNGQEKETADTINLNDMVGQFCKNTGRVIAEVNGQIVKTPEWKETSIKEGDTIELVTFVGGG